MFEKCFACEVWPPVTEAKHTVLISFYMLSWFEHHEELILSEDIRKSASGLENRHLHVICR